MSLTTNILWKRNQNINPTQVLQRLSIALAQVKVGNTFE